MKSTITMAIMAPMPLTQSGVAYLIHSLVPNVQCVATFGALDPLLTSWLPGQVTLLVTVLSGMPEVLAQDTQRLLLLSARDPALHIVVYTYCRDTRLLAQLHSRPQFSLLARQESDEQTRLDLAVALAGVKVCSPSIKARLLGMPPFPQEPGTTALTQAERKVLEYLSHGMNVSDIAHMLHRSIKTISAHKCNSMHKLGICNNSELFRALHTHVANMPYDHQHPALFEMLS